VWQWLSLKPRLLILGGIVLILGILYGTHKVIVYKAVQKAKAEIQATLQAQYTQKLLEASELAREREKVMVESADRLRKEKDAQIANLNSRLGTALDGLRQRPQRSPSPEGSPASCNCQGATGASLSREDGEFLVREAARADSLRTALDQCYKQYDSVRQSVK
jgi:hypothetical protein